MTHTVSVIVPVYNEEKYIGSCLKSLIRQDRRATEIIVVNDGSTDASAQVVKEFAVKLISQNHSGPGLARNKGAQMARGDILVFADADMKFAKHYLQDLVSPIEKELTKATYSAEERVGNLANFWARAWNEVVGGRQNLNIKELANNFRAIQKKLFLHLGGFKDLGYGEDTSVFAGTRYKALGTKAVCFHFNPGSLREVFISARWMGRGEIIKNKFVGLLVFSALNSFRKGLTQGVKRKNIRYIVFQMVFDAGIWWGIIEKMLKSQHVK